MDALVQTSCWVILVTDSNHLLSKSEKNFLSDHSGKPNLSLMVNILPESDENQVDQDLKEELGQENIPKDLVKLKDQDLAFLSEKFTLLKQSNQVLQDSAVYSAIKKLTNLKDELEISKNNLNSIGEFLKQLQSKIQLKEEQIYSSFRKIDLVILEQDLGEVILGLRTFFSNYSFWKLLYKSDYLAQDLQVVFC